MGDKNRRKVWLVPIGGASSHVYLRVHDGGTFHTRSSTLNIVVRRNMPEIQWKKCVLQESLILLGGVTEVLETLLVSLSHVCLPSHRPLFRHRHRARHIPHLILMYRLGRDRLLRQTMMKTSYHVEFLM